MRQCGECTLCCTLMRVPEPFSAEGVTCQHCDVGCMIHSTRPETCRTWDCGWLQGDMGEEMRPDKSHVVIEKFSEKVVIAMIEPG